MDVPNGKPALPPETRQLDTRAAFAAALGEQAAQLVEMNAALQLLGAELAEKDRRLAAYTISSGGRKRG